MPGLLSLGGAATAAGTKYTAAVRFSLSGKQGTADAVTWSWSGAVAHELRKGIRQQPLPCC